MKEYIEKGRNDLCVVKDVDESKGIVQAYWSAFGNVDSDNDIMLPGAFTKTIKEMGPTSTNKRIKSLMFHDPTKIIGKVIELEEDKVGLKATIQLSKNTDDGRDALGKYQDELITEHSVGMNIIKSDNEKESREISEARLWEGSGVTWGANELTPPVGLKSFTPQAIFDRVGKLEGILSKGKYTDETFESFETQLQQLKAYLSSLIGKEPLVSTLDDKPTFSEKLTLLTNYLN